MFVLFVCVFVYVLSMCYMFGTIFNSHCFERKEDSATALNCPLCLNVSLNCPPQLAPTDPPAVSGLPAQFPSVPRQHPRGPRLPAGGPRPVALGRLCPAAHPTLRAQEQGRAGAAAQTFTGGAYVDTFGLGRWLFAVGQICQLIFYIRGR